MVFRAAIFPGGIFLVPQLSRGLGQENISFGYFDQFYDYTYLWIIIHNQHQQMQSVIF